MQEKITGGFNPYFIGLPILIAGYKGHIKIPVNSFNPYFIGLPILIIISIDYFRSVFRKVSILILLDYLFLSSNISLPGVKNSWFQSLFYWITYSYLRQKPQSKKW